MRQGTVGRLCESLLSKVSRFFIAIAILGLLPALAGGCARGSPPPRPGSIWREPVTGMELVYLPAGRFRMGTDPAQPSRQPDEVPHEVTLTRGFYLGRFEVTQGEWRQVIGGDPSQFPACGPRCPIETVSYFDVQRFVKRLSALSGVGGLRLPTEAEWEYACRAGTETAFSTGAHLTTGQANFDGRYPLALEPPGRFVGHPVAAGS
jgi:formylglycine-generating enzyme required for sulfatase activity